jgi:hypothetical protein
VDWEDYVTGGALTADQILNGNPLVMDSGNSLDPDPAAGTIGGAPITDRDQAVGNGVVQVLGEFVTSTP